MLSFIILKVDKIVQDEQYTFTHQRSCQHPDIRNGAPTIAGTSIRIMDIVAYHKYGDKLNAEQLAEGFRLSLGQIHAALAYYYLHQAELDKWLETEQLLGERVISELEAQGKAQRIQL